MQTYDDMSIDQLRTYIARRAALCEQAQQECTATRAALATRVVSEAKSFVAALGPEQRKALGDELAKVRGS